jgi:hypothetical protein
MVVVSVGGDFMPAVPDLSDQTRQLLRNPPKNEKGGFGFERKAVQEIQDQMGIFFHPQFKRIPS